MESFNMHIPTRIYFGEAAIKDLSVEIRKYGRKVLLVIGQGSIMRNGIYEDVLAAFELGEIDHVTLEGVESNPRLDKVIEGAQLCQSHNIDLILAVGGGSVIDCAKTIAVAALYDGNPWELVTKKVAPKQALPIGVVLTLAATGSEMNGNAVITKMDTNEKIGWHHALLWPKFSILDPTYTFTVSSHQTACGIVDTLTHLYEYYFNEKESGDLSDRMSEAVMTTVIRHGKKVMTDPQDYEARSNLMWAGTVALNGMVNRGKCFDGFNHRLEHALSAVSDITHGDGLAIIVPHWMTYVLDEKTAPKLARFARNVWGVVGEDDMEDAKKGIERLRRFYEFLDMPNHLSHVHMDEDQFDLVLERLFTTSTIGSFKALTMKDARRILTAAL